MAALEQGKTILVMSQTSSGPGTEVRSFSVECDTVQTSLFVSSITGTLSVVISTITENGQAKEVIEYNDITAVSTSLLIKKAATTMGAIRAVATFSGACSFELRAKGLSSGETSAKIQSATIGKASQLTVGTLPIVLVPAAMTDRSGIIVKNNSNGAATLYLGFSAAEALPAVGYPIGSKEALGLDIGAGAVLWGSSGSHQIDVRLIEAGG